MLLANEQKVSAKETDGPVPSSAINAIESEVVDLFVQIARVLGWPRSVGEIYGLLFIAAQPMTMDHLIARLKISKGSASQGLKLLRDVGAVQMIYIPNSRKLHYEAAAELRNLMTRFLRDKIVPRLDTGITRLDRLTGMVKQLPPPERARMGKRVALLQSWQKRARRFLPVVARLLAN